MKKILFATIAAFAFCVTAAGANHVYVRNKQNLRCEGYFPQISPDGKKVIATPTDAKKLYIYDLDTQKREVVVDEGVPGFEAIFGKNGKVYYVSMKINKDHLIFRSVREYDPASGSDREVLSAQHGAVHAINGTTGTAAVGEHKEWNTQAAGTFAWSLGSNLYVYHNGEKQTFSPVNVQTGYLWADVSPDGKKVLFHVPAMGLYVCDAKDGRIINKLDGCLMPKWYDNDLIVAQGRGRWSYNIIIFRADGTGGIQSLASGECVMPSVSGHQVIYTTKSGNVKLLTLETPDERSTRLEQEREEAERIAKEKAEEAARIEAEKEAEQKLNAPQTNE